MSTITWKVANTGSFATGTNWSGNVAPGAADDALINAGPASYTVTSAVNATVANIGVAHNATLDVTGSTFTFTNGTDPAGLAGLVKVENGATLSAGGITTNSGSIVLGATTLSTEMLLNTLLVTLNGGGSVQLSNSTFNLITGATSSDQLENVNNAISGAGDIGNGQMVLTNDHSGVINANQATPLIIDTAGNAITNLGTMEATAGGTLVVDSAITNTGGTIKAVGAGSEVILNAAVTGGAVLTSGGGTILFNNTNFTLDGRGTHPASYASNLQIANGHAIYLYGVVNNTGTIGLNSTGDNTDLVAASGFVTLQGGGKVVLSNSYTNRIYGASGSYTLTNVNDTISGAGQLGAGQLHFVNSGTVNANQNTPLQLFANNDYAKNTGLLEATSTGGLSIYQTTIINQNGTISASGAGAHVDIVQNANIQGGTLTTAAGGVIQTPVGATGNLDGISFGAVSNKGTLLIGESSVLNVAGSIINTGTIVLDQISPNSGSTLLQITYPLVTLSGGGQVMMTDNSRNYIYANNSLHTLTNVDNRISGAGQLGDQELTLINQTNGVINANVAGVLEVDTRGAVPMINRGTLESTGTTALNGGLEIDQTAVNNAGGTVQAIGNNAHVDLSNSAIEGGTLITTGAGVIQTSAGVSGNLDGVTVGALTITTNSHVQINDGTNLYLEGNIVNHGTLLESSSGASTYVYVNSPIVTLSGGGQVKLSNVGSNIIQANGNSSNLLDNVDNTISGAGSLGSTSLTFINEASGIVNANAATPLTLDTYYSGPAVNRGLMEATGSGGLAIGANGYSTSVANSGTLLAATGSHVNLASGTVQGGTLTTAGTGIIQTVAGDGGLDGSTATGAVTITTGSQVKVSEATRLYLEGTIVNNGTLLESSTGTSNTTYIFANSGLVTLTGGGLVKLSNSANNVITANGNSSFTLDNLDNTIAGAGNLGNNSLTFINEVGGIVNANLATALTLATYYSAPTVNRGLMEATGSGGLAIGVNGYSTVVQNSGTVLAATGSHVNLASGTVRGGKLATAGTGVIQTVAGDGGLDGSTSFGSVTITAGSQVKVNEATRLYLEGTIINDGTLLENSTGTSNTTYIYVNSGLVTLTGGGLVKLSNSANNVITANGNSQFTLDNHDNTISGAGALGSTSLTFVNDAAGIVNANATTPLTLNTYYSAPAVNHGLMEATSSGGLSITSTDVINTGGTIQALVAGSHVDLRGGDISGGTITTGAAGVGTIRAYNGGTLDGQTVGAITNTGTVAVQDQQSMYLAGTIDNTGRIALNATSTGNGSYTSMQILGNVALTGGGSVVMSNVTNAANQFGNYINANGGNSTLRLDNVDNTISGAGQLGAAGMAFVNEAGGTVNANAAKTGVNASGQLTLNTQYALPAVNHGLMEATNTGGLIITSTSVVNTGGTIQALTTGSHIDLYGATIEGGTIKTGAAGVGTIKAYSGSELDGGSAGPITNAGTVVVQDQQNVYLAGTINNTGQIFLDQTSAAGSTHLYLSSQFVTLTGGGTLVLSNNAGNTVTDGTGDPNFTLVNLNNTISGAGDFGPGMQISNTGKIIANQSLALTLDSAAGKIVNNAGGLMQATAAGGLVINRAIFQNNDTVQVNDGSTVTFNSGVYTTNNEAGELFGGTWNVIATTHGATMSITGGPMVIDSASILLNGANTVLQSWNGSTEVALESSLTTISPTVGSLNIAGGRNYTTGNAFADNGSLVLGGGTFHAGSLAVGGMGQILGIGTVNDAVANAGMIQATGGTLNVTGNLTGTGRLQALAASTLSLNGTSNTAASVLDNGTITLGASDSLDISGLVNPASTGVFILNNASLLDVGGDTGAGNKMNFLGTGKLAVDAVAQFGTNVGLGTYTGPKMLNFGVGDQIDLKDLVFAGAAIDSYTSATGLLQLHSGSTKATLLFDNATLGAGTFHIANDTHGDVLLTHS